MIEKLLDDISALVETRKKEYNDASARFRFYLFKYKNVENVEWYKASFGLMVCLFISETIALFMKPSAVDPFAYMVLALCFIRIGYSLIYNFKYRHFIKKSNRERNLALYRYENALFLEQRAAQAAAVEKSVSDAEQNNEFIKGLYDGIKLQYDTEKGFENLS